MKTKLTLIISILLAASSLFAQDNPYAARRERIFEIIGDDVAIIKNSGRDYTLSMDVNWNYYYLTGDDTEKAVVVLNGKSESAMIFRDGGQFRRRMDSIINSVEIKPMSEFTSHVQRSLYGTKNIWMDFSAKVDLSELGPMMQNIAGTKNLRNQIHKMRSIKDDHEMELLTHAIQTTADGLVEVMKAAEPGMNEKDFELILKYKFEKAGCENLGFGIQAASGPNATSVHYGANDRDTKDGDMMVFDVGARSGFYSADISRSFPVNGKFTKEQKEIYSLVLKAQKAAISKMKPGVNIGIASQAALEVLNDGLADLGLITDRESAWQNRFWIQHGFFHHIGLVVHDVGGYSSVLEPGMIITMEPGLYFPENYLDEKKNRRLFDVWPDEAKPFLEAITPIFKKYVNIGVRIEDDVYITEDGNKTISSGVPKEIEDIEKLMKETSMFNNK